MEIATHLGLLAVALSEMDDEEHVMDNARTALCEAQMIMYEFARQELVEQTCEEREKQNESRG